MTTTVTEISTTAVANGTAPIPFTFQAVSAEEIGVTLGDVLLDYGTDYTVTLNGDGTGTITPLSAWSGTVVVFSNPDLTQKSNFTRFGPFYPDMFNEPLDRLARSLLSFSKRSLFTPLGEKLNTLSNKATRAGRYLLWDSDGQPTEGVSSTELATIMSSAASNSTAITALSAQIAAIAGVSISITGSVTAVDRAALALVPTTAGMVFVSEPGSEGIFKFDSADYSAEVSYDPINYVAPAGGDGSTGAWVCEAGFMAGVRRFSYGPRPGERTLRKGVALSDVIHTFIVGDAAGATGGLGKTKYIVDNRSTDPNKVGTFNWALSQARNNAGGCIEFDTRGHFNIPIDDNLHRVDFDDLTIIAPGRNVTFWAVPLAGSFIINAHNIIGAFIEFRTMPGTLAAYNADGTKAEQKLVNIGPHVSDLVALIGCEFRHASDGACDITSSLLTADDPVCRVTIQDFIMWDTDQPMMVGSGDPTVAVDDPPLLKLTLHNGIFAGCGERQPKVLGRCRVLMSQIYTYTLPFQRDQLAPTNEFSTCYGAEALSGGTLLAQGCLWEPVLGSGYPALMVAADANGVDGAVDAIDCVALGGMTIVPGNTSRIPAIGFALNYDVPPATVGREQEKWIADRWATCGARVDAAPEGMFAWTPDETAYPNFETVLPDRQVGGRWLRVDAQPEFLVDDQATSDVLDPLALVRGTTLTVASGAVTLTDDRVVAITGEGAAADTLSTISFTTNPAYTSPIINGLVIIRTSSSSVPITVDNSGNIATQHKIILNDASQWLGLLWEPSTSKWTVVFEPLQISNYTPALTAALNCSALVLTKARYKKFGRMVQVSLSGTATVTAAGTTNIGVALPIAAPNLADGELSGTMGADLGSGRAFADTVNKRATLRFVASASGAAVPWSAIFEYEIN